MNKNQVLTYRVLELTNDLIGVLWDTSIIRNLWNSKNLLKYFTVADQAQEQEIRFLLIIYIDKNHFKKGEHGEKNRNFKKPFEFNSFSQIFYCGMTRLRNMSLGVFTQCQYARTILRNKNMGYSLLKKHSKFQWNILLWHDQAQEHEFGCFYTLQAYKTHFMEQKCGTESV